MRRYFFLFAAILLPFITFAQHRSESSAISIAHSFWGTDQSELKAIPQKTINKTKAHVAKTASAISGSKQSFYIISPLM